MGFWCFKILNFNSINKNTKKVCNNNITQKKLDSLQYLSNNKKKFSKLLSIIIQKELNLSQKYNFNLLIGHWLHKIIDILLNRYYTIDNILKNKVEEIYLLNLKTLLHTLLIVRVLIILLIILILMILFMINILN